MNTAENKADPAEDAAQSRLQDEGNENRDQQNQALQESEERYRAVVQQVSEGIFLLDVESMRLLEANAAFQRMLGYSEQEVPDLTIYDLLPYERERINHATHKALQEGDYHVSDRLYKHKDGTLLHVEVGITPITYGGRMVLCEVLRDVSERRRVQEELRRSRDQLEVILQGVQDGITVQDAGGQLIFANAAALKILGFSSQDELLRASISQVLSKFELLDENGNPFAHDDLPGRHALRGEEPPEKLIGWHHIPSGEVQWSLVNATAVKDDQGNVLMAITIFRDITERKELEKRKDDFIALASHELKTPISTIKGYTQLLSRDPRLTREERTLRRLRNLDIAANRLAQLVNEMLDVSRIERGQMDFHMQPLDLAALTAEVIAELRVLTDRHRITLQVEYAEGEKRAIMVSGDPERLRQVLTNLLENAIKYSPRGGEIDIRISRGDERVLVTVKDNGIGIPGDQIGRVFERFYRGANVSVHNYAGMGLGLAISYEIVKRHGGEMWAESTPGEGSTFSFSLPA